MIDTIYQTIQVRLTGPVFTLRFARPEAGNTINARLIEECHQALSSIDETVQVVVVEGSPTVFCLGADFKEVSVGVPGASAPGAVAEPMYELWSRLANGPWITVAHVRGKANAGGVGFVAACDIVIADRTADFSLSEMLFGLFPACVLPFLIRRIGRQRAHYLTLSTQPLNAEQALAWGLVDVCDTDSDVLLRRQLGRLRCISRLAVQRYRQYMETFDDQVIRAKRAALAANRAIFTDKENLEKIARYVNTGKFPWEP